MRAALRNKGGKFYGDDYGYKVNRVEMSVDHSPSLKSEVGADKNEIR